MKPTLIRTFLRALALFAAMTASSLIAAPTLQTQLPRVTVNGHYLQLEDGRPFFWLGDTAWKLVHSTTRDECSYYLKTRATQGFSVIQMVGVTENSGETFSTFGQTAFHNQDPRRPNDAYFDRLVEIVDEAASLGMYVALVPVWGDRLTAPWGDGPRIFTLDNLADARAFGRYLGTRLRERTNVLWVIGGDRPARLKGLKNDFLQGIAKRAGFAPDHDWTPIWRELTAGVSEATPVRPVTVYHPQGGEFSSSQQLPDAEWIAVNGMQSGHGGGHDIPVWKWVARDYSSVPVKPTIDLEPNYEDHPYNPWPAWDPATGYFRDHDVRKQVYRSVFAGACGVTYGHHAVWQFASARNGVINFADRDWIDALHRPAAAQMRFLRQLMQSRPYLTRVPDPSLVKNAVEDGASHIVAMRDNEGSYAFVYFPRNDLTARIDLTKLRGARLKAWWYDTRTGFAHPAGEFEHAGEKEFKSPPYGPDWVLVLDDASTGYRPPGA